MNRPLSLPPAPVAGAAPGRTTRPATRPATGLVTGLVTAVLATLLLVAGGAPADAAPPADGPIGTPTPTAPGTTPTTPRTRSAAERRAGRVKASRAARARQAAAEALPLTVTIDTLSPSYVPARGPIRVTGTVTNTDAEAWQRINVYPVIGPAPAASGLAPQPMTTEAELAEAAASDPDTYVGDRITTPGMYATLETVEPGESVPFSFQVPRSALGVSAAGVYWFGVQALGESTAGRDLNADGRARTFLPLVASDAAPVRTALVLPLRREVSHTADGSIDDVEAWDTTLGSEGRLRALVDFGAAAGDRPITWLLDPALTDAAQQLADGNPARSIQPTLTTDGEQPSDGPTVTLSPATGADDQGTDGTGDAAEDETGATDPDVLATSEAASAWLDRLRDGLGGQQVLALPYGDLDVAAAAAHAPTLVTEATDRTGSVLAPFETPVDPVVGSPSGFLDAAGIRASDPSATVLLTDQMLTKAFPDGAPTVASAEGHRLVITSSAAAEGGPGPTDPFGTIGVRQRILSEVALRTLDTGDTGDTGTGAPPQPLVVMLPQQWTPDSPVTFFDGLDTDWLQLSTVEGVASGPATPISLDDLTYPSAQTARELDAATFASVADLIGAGNALQGLLSLNDQVGSVVRDEALTSLSYATRTHADAVRLAVDRSTQTLESTMQGVSIEAPPGVNLSSTTGRFSVTVSNDLDQPVTVGIEPRSDGDLEIAQPDPIEIGAGGRASVLLNATTTENGVHDVTLMLTNAGGTPIGASDELPIRSAQVSNVIWLFLGGGAALLFGAIGVRLFRRVRAAARSARGESRAADPA